MKIDKTTSNKIENSVFTTNEKKVSTNSQDSFQTKLNKVSLDNYEAKIASLLDQIEDQAKKLSKKVDIKELKVYKRMVSELLNETVNNSHKFSKENKLDRQGRHRVYAVIKQINDNLESLTQEILKEEKDNLLIIDRLDDIRGLLLDICT